MEEKKSVFAYISKIFATYGVIVAIFILFSLLIGEGTGDYSPLFRLGRAGLTLETLLELLLLAAVVTLVQVLFFTDRWIKNMPILRRNVLFFLTVLAAIVLLIVLFKWFPLSDVTAWIGFLLSFVPCMVAGILIFRLRERAENKRMQNALEKFKSGRPGEPAEPADD